MKRIFPKDWYRYEFFRPFDFYILSLCFFRVKRPGEMLQILTCYPSPPRWWPSPHRWTTPLHKLIDNTPQQLSLAPCSQMVSAASILDIARFVTFHEIETHLQNLLRSQHLSDGELPNPSPSDPRLNCTWLTGEWWSFGASLQVMYWLSGELMYVPDVFVHVVHKSHRNSNNPHLRCKETGWDVFDASGVSVAVVPKERSVRPPRIM
jgi:hypothetical protein